MFRALPFLAFSSLLLAPDAPAASRPAWMDTAVVYGVTPYLLEEGGGFRAVESRLEDWRTLGANVLWLQPIFRNHGGGQGYDVTDFLGLRRDYGDTAGFRRLVRKAHALGMRVILDFPANHVSVHHPWFRSAAAEGPRSPYWEWFQRDSVPGTPYAAHYTRDSLGFLHYFWKDLVNLDYSEPEVRNRMKEAILFWVREFDVDGFRFDASWAVSARLPSFFPELNREIKRLKPDALLLAEDKAGADGVFAQGFDAAYDWGPGEEWVSQWAWQTDFDPERNPTVFNADTAERVPLLREALFPGGGPPEGRPLRFLENNDTHRFVAHHGPRTTRLAATLQFALPGLPLVYNGQEIGVAAHPYASGPLFRPGVPVKSLDSLGLFDHYRRLIHLRKTEPALGGDSLVELESAPGNQVYAFLRPHPVRPLLCVFNLGGRKVSATVRPPDATGTAGAESGAWRDVLGGGRHGPVTGGADLGWTLDLAPGEARILGLAGRKAGRGGSIRGS